MLTIIGMGFVLVGFLFLTGFSQPQYAPGDLRGTAAYNIVVGGVMLVAGAGMLYHVLRMSRK